MAEPTIPDRGPELVPGPHSAAWPIDADLTWVRNSQGLRLGRIAFPAKQPKATVILVAGVGVTAAFEWMKATEPGGPHSRFEGSVPQILRDAGLNVVVIENQGLGNSDRVRPGVDAFFESFDDLANDLLTIHDDVLKTTPSLPIFWLGISMGGGVIARASQLRPKAAAGIVMLAPMISLTTVREEYIVPALGIRNRHLYPIMDTVSKWLPTLCVVKPAMNTVHPLNQQEKDLDPNNWQGALRTRIATEFVKVTEAFMDGPSGPNALEKIQCRNVLLMHALADTFTEPAGSVAVYERCQCDGTKALVRFGRDGAKSEFTFDGPPAAKDELIALDGLKMWHALTQEPGSDRIAAACASWICAIVATSASL